MKYLGEGKPQYLELGGGGTSVGELRIQFSHLFHFEFNKHGEKNSI